MKKFSLTVLLLLLFLSLLGCSDNVIDTDTDADTEQISTDTETLDTSIKISGEEKERREENELDYQIPYISEEDGYYSVIWCGRYLGDDFKNADYYADYYRIIDNYEDFCELTQLGSQFDKEIFNGYSVLVIHRYTNKVGNYSYRFYNLEQYEPNVYNETLQIWSNLAAYTLPIINAEVRQTFCLLIPNSDLPQDVEMNGKIGIAVNAQG